MSPEDAPVNSNINRDGAKWLIAIQWRLMSLAASCDTVTVRIFPRVAMTTDTGRVSEISQRRPSLWEVVLAIWNRRRVSADTPTRFAASFCETPSFMSFRPASRRRRTLEGLGSGGAREVGRPGVPTGLRDALARGESARLTNQIFFVVVPFSLWFRGHDGAP